MKSLSCPNGHCLRSGKGNVGAIIRHGFYTTRSGKRPHYQCRTCGKTFCSTTRTPCYRLPHRRVIFDEVASLSVEGLNKSAIGRVKRRSIAGWKKYVLSVQPSQIKGTLHPGAAADEIRTIVGGREQAIWILCETGTGKELIALAIHRQSRRHSSELRSHTGIPDRF